MSDVKKEIHSLVFWTYKVGLCIALSTERIKNFGQISGVYYYHQNEEKSLCRRISGNE